MRRRWLYGAVLAAMGSSSPALGSHGSSHGASPPSVLVEPRPSTGTLEVRAISGAQVEIDGRRLGEAPVTLALPLGRHRVEVTAPGHHPWQATIELGSGAVVALTPEMVGLEAVEGAAPAPEPEVHHPPIEPGVFLATTRSRVFLAARPERAGASALLAAKRDPEQAEVFLAVEKRRVFLPSTSRDEDVFLPSKSTDEERTFMMPAGRGALAVPRGP